MSCWNQISIKASVYPNLKSFLTNKYFIRAQSKSGQSQTFIKSFRDLWRQSKNWYLVVLEFLSFGVEFCGVHGGPVLTVATTSIFGLSGHCLSREIKVKGWNKGEYVPLCSVVCNQSFLNNGTPQWTETTTSSTMGLFTKKTCMVKWLGITS